MAKFGPMPKDSDARVWLRSVGLGTIADEIDRIMQSWKDRGLKTRRNWWEALGGTPSGRPVTVEGFVFPILAAVRERRGLEPVKGAVKLRSSVAVPEEVPQARWESRPIRRSPKVSKKGRAKPSSR